MSKQAYYAARAIDERLQAQTATNPSAAAAHLEMSARYEALASDPSLALPTAELATLDPPSDEVPES
ncbi:hypothetical protein [Sphingomonas sp.]|uniref:hypothetical protein n=1 Tax=Sphingomonas sp. TaxID=28214 RepID=UPI00286A9A24|nr:hypothetical protein [Sphingomonas sp.]